MTLVRPKLPLTGTSYLNNTGYIGTYGGGTFTLAGNAIVFNQTAYTYGDDYSGDGTLIIEASATFNNAGSLNLADDGILTNAGTLELYENSTFYLYSGAQVTNTNYLESAGATITINGGASIDNEGSMALYDASTLTVTAGEYDDADAVLDNSGWLDIYDSSTLTATGNADNEIIAQVNNTGTLDIYDGGTLTINGSLFNDTDGTITQTGCELNISSSGDLDSAGTFDASGGEITNDGFVYALDGAEITIETGSTVYNT